MDELVGAFIKHRFDYKRHWDDGSGRKSTRTIEHLFAEISSGKSELHWIEDRFFARVFTSVFTHLYYPLTAGTWQQLRKDYTKLPNGELKLYEKNRSANTKVASGETAESAATRVIGSVTGFKNPKLIDISPAIKPWKPGPHLDLENRDYPGIVTIRKRVSFASVMPKGKYQSRGYKITKPDNTETHYKWLPIMPDRVPIGLYRSVIARQSP